MSDIAREKLFTIKWKPITSIEQKKVEYKIFLYDIDQMRNHALTVRKRHTNKYETIRKLQYML